MMSVGAIYGQKRERDRTGPICPKWPAPPKTAWRPCKMITIYKNAAYNRRAVAQQTAIARLSRKSVLRRLFPSRRPQRLHGHTAQIRGVQYRSQKGRRTYDPESLTLDGRWDWLPRNEKGIATNSASRQRFMGASNAKPSVPRRGMPARNCGGFSKPSPFQSPEKPFPCSLRIPAKSVKKQFARSVKACAARQAAIRIYGLLFVDERALKSP